MKKIKFASIALFASAVFCLNRYYELVAFNCCKDSTNDSFSVMTWNIHCPQGTDASSQELIAHYILDKDVDILSLNEYLVDSCLVIDSILKTRYEFSYLSDCHELCGNAIYSKYRIEKSKHLYADVEGRHAYVMSAYVMIGGDSLLLIGVHLPSNNGEDDEVLWRENLYNTLSSYYHRYRQRQISRSLIASAIKTRLSSEIVPCVVMGDYNDFASSAPLDTLRDYGLKDAWWKGGMGYGCTFHNSWLRLRIDHILYSPEIRLCDVEICHSELSDHNPVIAKFYK